MLRRRSRPFFLRQRAWLLSGQRRGRVHQLRLCKKRVKGAKAWVRQAKRRRHETDREREWNCETLRAKRRRPRITKMSSAMPYDLRIASIPWRYVGELNQAIGIRGFHFWEKARRVGKLTYPSVCWIWPSSKSSRASTRRTCFLTSSAMPRDHYFLW